MTPWLGCVLGIRSPSKGAAPYGRPRSARNRPGVARRSPPATARVSERRVRRDAQCVCPEATNDERTYADARSGSKRWYAITRASPTHAHKWPKASAQMGAVLTCTSGKRTPALARPRSTSRVSERRREARLSPCARDRPRVTGRSRRIVRAPEDSCYVGFSLPALGAELTYQRQRELEANADARESIRKDRIEDKQIGFRRVLAFPCASIARARFTLATVSVLWSDPAGLHLRIETGRMRAEISNRGNTRCGLRRHSRCRYVAMPIHNNAVELAEREWTWSWLSGIGPTWRQTILRPRRIR